MFNFLLGILAASVPVTLAYYAGRHSRPSPPAQLCSCDHGYGSHMDGKSCQADIRRLRDGCSSTYDWVPCPCLTYDGPEPLSAVMNWRP
jgi:hypothetical protein